MNKRGFTLLEMVVALSLAGILLSILLSSITQAMIGSREAIDKGQALVIAENQLQTYLAGERYSMQGVINTDEGRKFQWSIREYAAGDDILKAEVTVSWQGLRGSRRLKVSELEAKG